MIEVKNLQKSFKGVEVLKGINETIEKGEKVVIVGPSGSGKSTFLRCLNRLEEPTGGEIWFEGTNICAARWAWCSSSLICSRTCLCVKISRSRPSGLK